MAVKVVSILNMKGGVGKTTITLNLAHVLASRMQKRVLVVDFDPQANASGGLLSFEEYEKHRDTKKVISDIFSDLERIVGPISKKNEVLLTLDDMVCRAREFTGGGIIDLVPSELELSTVLERSGGANLEDRLKLILKDKKNRYDYVLIDCGPTYSVLTNNALKASDYILIPVKPDPFSARGIPLLLKKIQAHNLANVPEDQVKVLGIVFSMVDDSVRYVASVKAEIFREHKNVFQNEIRFNELYSRGLFENRSILETNAQGHFKTNIIEVTKEFVSKAV